MKKKKTLIIDDGIKEIPAYAYNETSYEEVIIPDSVEAIGDYAFANMKHLKKVRLSNNFKLAGMGIFMGCSSLEEITLPDSLTYIPREFLAECTSLKRINNTDKLSYIDHYGLYKCTNLEDFDLPETLTYLGLQALYGCEKIEKLTIHKNLNDIECGALAYMTNLSRFDMDSDCEKYITIDHKSLIERENGIFIQYAIGCKDTEYKIDHYYISFDENVNNTYQREDIYNLADYAFAGAKYLEHLELSSLIESFGPKTFDGVKAKYVKFLNAPYGDNFIFSSAPIYGEIDLPFEEIEFEDGIKSIASNTSNLFNNAKHVRLPNTIEKIGSNIFNKAINLEEIFIPSSIKQIYANAFHDETLIKMEGFKDFKAKELIMMQTKLSDALKYSAFSYSSDLTRIISFTNGEYYIKFDCYDYIKITKDEIKEFGKNSNVLVDDPERFLEFFDDLYYCYTNLSEEFLNIISDKELHTLFDNFYKDYQSIESLSDIKFRELIDKITKNNNRFNELILDGLFMKNISRGNILLILSNMNPTLERFINVTKFLEVIDQNSTKFDAYDVKEVTDYCNCLDKYKQKDRYLFNLTFATNSKDEYKELLAKYYNKLIKNILTKFNAENNSLVFGDLLKIFRVFGIFNDDQVFAQKMATFFMDKVFNEEYEYSVIGGDIHRVFNEMRPTDKINYDFIKFFVDNYDELIKQNILNSGFIARVYNNFNDIQKFSTSNKGNCRKKEVTIDKCLYYFVYKTFTNVNENNKELAMFLGKFYEENGVLTKAEELLKKANGSLRNIYTLSLSEDEDLIGEEKNGYKYKWLDKQSKYNLVLGKLCNCCAHICGAGAGIMYSSMILNDFQNLVILKNGDIIAKATVYVNRLIGTALFNTVEISSIIDKTEYGYIYEVLNDGIDAFIEKYNQNHDIHITRVNVGTNQNQLLDYFENDCMEADENKMLEQFDYSQYSYTIGNKEYGTHKGDAYKQLILK